MSDSENRRSSLDLVWAMAAANQSEARTPDLHEVFNDFLLLGEDFLMLVAWKSVRFRFLVYDI